MTLIRRVARISLLSALAIAFGDTLLVQWTAGAASVPLLGFEFAATFVLFLIVAGGVGAFSTVL